MTAIMEYDEYADQETRSNKSEAQGEQVGDAKAVVHRHPEQYVRPQ